MGGTGNLMVREGNSGCEMDQKAGRRKEMLRAK